MRTSDHGQRWMDAEGVVLTGNWLDAENKPLGSFTIPPPDTQDRWVEPTTKSVRPISAGLADRDHSPLGRRSPALRRFLAPRGPDQGFHGGVLPSTGAGRGFLPDLRMVGSQCSLRGTGNNMDGDLQHSQYALANFNVGYSARFGVKYQGSVPAEIRTGRTGRGSATLVLPRWRRTRRRSISGTGRINERVKSPGSVQAFLGEPAAHVWLCLAGRLRPLHQELHRHREADVPHLRPLLLVGKEPAGERGSW